MGFDVVAAVLAAGFAGALLGVARGPTTVDRVSAGVVGFWSLVALVALAGLMIGLDRLVDVVARYVPGVAGDGRLGRAHLQDPIVTALGAILIGVRAALLLLAGLVAASTVDLPMRASTLGGFGLGGVILGVALVANTSAVWIKFGVVLAIHFWVAH